MNACERALVSRQSERLDPYHEAAAQVDNSLPPEGKLDCRVVKWDDLRGLPLSRSVSATLSFLNHRDATRNRPTMKPSLSHDERIAKMTFSSVYPHYVAKVEKKGRTKEELHEVIQWLTGFDEGAIQQLINDKVTFEQFFQQATLNPLAHLITGVICGYRIEEIENPLTKRARYLDKLVDELAKGRKMEKILRSA